jgi:predicted lipoprotein with Yx(FWY)xxD motif
MIAADRPFGLVRGLALASAALILVAACSSSAASATPAATTAPTAAPASAAPAGSAAGGGETYEVAVATVAAGKTLTGEDGRTLYIFKKDTTPGKSVCNGDCATKWPPFTTTAADTLKAGAGVSGTLATIKRDDGTDQVTYNGAPLYYFAADTKAGDSTGDKVGGIWFIAAP